MGLVLPQYTTESELVIENAYVKIHRVETIEERSQLEVKLYVSRESSRQGTPPFSRKYYSHIPDMSDNSPNYHKQGYRHIKSLTEFENAVDVLENGQNP